MDRRKFLQNMFGAAVVAAIPKPVFDAIIAQPEKVSPIFTKQCNENSKLLFIYDKDKLIGSCFNYSLNINFNYLPDVTTRDSNGWKSTIRGLQEWKISANNINWETKPESIYDRELKFLISHMGMNIAGNGYLTGYNYSLSMYENVNNAAMFKGSGKLILNT